MMDEDGWEYVSVVMGVDSVDWEGSYMAVKIMEAEEVVDEVVIIEEVGNNDLPTSGN